MEAPKMFHKHLKKCWTTLVIREMHVNSPKIHRIKLLDNPKHIEAVGTVMSAGWWDL